MVIYLTSQVRIEHGETLLGERDMPGRRGRVALALLVAERDRPATRDELAEGFWLEEPPPAWEKAVMAVVSKLRARYAGRAWATMRSPRRSAASRGASSFATPDHEESVESGDAFYMAPGHVPVFVEDAEMFELSPADELRAVLDVVSANAARLDEQLWEQR